MSPELNNDHARSRPTRPAPRRQCASTMLDARRSSPVAATGAVEPPHQVCSFEVEVPHDAISQGWDDCHDSHLDSTGRRDSRYVPNGRGARKYFRDLRHELRQEMHPDSSVPVGLTPYQIRRDPKLFMQETPVLESRILSEANVGSPSFRYSPVCNTGATLEAMRRLIPSRRGTRSGGARLFLLHAHASHCHGETVSDRLPAFSWPSRLGCFFHSGDRQPVEAHTVAAITRLGVASVAGALMDAAARSAESRPAAGPGHGSGKYSAPWAITP
ncbi:uncharacterized protein LY89DRAFT_665414 [Mollisia scopiformis]|uniref:Uncharacterized protein n=1 Tax=Mollisia scopiformis TaxID=149040 RepID=A0A194XLI1_MOLSC|nr:uncharacterized protein LY89DRAFT_665414 [Mollisia scopiformis]KUJ20939.1 hypothetical protein LY89DRAFT_665414 [Mollisia scopiformis]